MRKIVQWLMVGLVVFGLNACGGGGSAHNGADNPDGSPSSEVTLKDPNSFVLDENISDEMSDEIEIVGLSDDGNGNSGTKGLLTDVVAEKSISTYNIYGEEIEKKEIVFRSFNIGKWKEKLNDETTLLARIFIHPILMNLSDEQKLQVVATLQKDYAELYNDAMKYQRLTRETPVFSTLYNDAVSSLQAIAVKTANVSEAESRSGKRPPQDTKLGKYSPVNNSFTNLALLQLSSGDDNLEISNYADVYYGARLFALDGVKQDYSYPFFGLNGQDTVHLVNPVKGGAAGGLFAWLTNAVGWKRPNTEINYNQLLNSTDDLAGTHQALIELYKWQNDQTSLVNTLEFVNLLIKTIASTDKANPVKLLKKIENGVKEAEKAVNIADDALSLFADIPQLILNLYTLVTPKEYYALESKKAIESFAKNINALRNNTKKIREIFNFAPYNNEVAPNYNAIFKRFYSFSGMVLGKKNDELWEINQKALDLVASRVDKKKLVQLYSQIMFARKVFIPLIDSKIIKDFNKKYNQGNKGYSFEQFMIYQIIDKGYFDSKRKEDINIRREKNSILAKSKGKRVTTEYLTIVSRNLRPENIKNMSLAIVTKLGNLINQAKAVAEVNNITKNIVGDPVKTIWKFTVYLINSGVLDNLADVSADTILRFLSQLSPYGATAKLAGMVNDWSSYIAGNFFITNKQYFMMNFNNGKVSLSLPPVTYSGAAPGKMEDISVSLFPHDNWHALKGHNRMLMPVNGTNRSHVPVFNLFFTEKNVDGLLSDGDLKSMLKKDPYKDQVFLKFDLNIERSKTEKEDPNSFEPFGSDKNRVKDQKILSNDVVAVDIHSGKNNLSYVDLMKMWEHNTNEPVRVYDKTRGLYRESVTVKMEPTKGNDYILDDSIQQQSAGYYVYKAEDSLAVGRGLSITTSEITGIKQKLFVYNNHDYWVCSEVRYDYKVHTVEDDTKWVYGGCIAPHTARSYDLKKYLDDNYENNDVYFYFYDGLVEGFMLKEGIYKPYMHNWAKWMKQDPAMYYYKVALDDVTENKLPTPVIKVSSSAPKVGDIVWFDASSSTDEDGEIIAYRWYDKNFNLVSDQKKFSKIMDQEGYYYLQLYVYDNKGAYKMANINVKVISNSEDIDLTSGLVAHYTFDDPGNIGKDSSGNGNDGSAEGGVGTVDGVIGKALKLSNDADENYQYIDLGHYDGFDVNYVTEKITLSAYVKTTDDEGEIFCDNTASGWYDFMIYDGKLSYTYRNTSWKWGGRVNSNKTVNDGKWHHVLIIIDGYTTKLYVDGEFDNQETFTDTKLTWSGTTHGKSGVSIGAVGFKQNDTGRPEWYSWYLDGSIDDLRIYNRALNEAEIKKLYEMGLKK